MQTPAFQIREFRDADGPSWLRCRALSFLATAYFDDVKTEPTVFDGEAIRLVAVHPRPDGITTAGPDEVIGLLDVELWDDAGRPAATIDSIAVHPDHQRRGVADALLASALEQLADRPAEYLDAWTREDPEANGWYSHAGFAIDQEYLHVYLRPYDPRERATGFSAPDGLVVVGAFCHGKLADEQHWRERFDRVHRCRRYLRQLPNSADAERAGPPVG